MVTTKTHRSSTASGWSACGSICGHARTGGLPMNLTLVQRSLLEKVAQDNGFDAPVEATDTWLAFSSTQVPLKLWLGAVGEGWCAAFSHPGVAAELAALTSPTAVSPPAGAAAVRQVGDMNQL